MLKVAIPNSSVAISRLGFGCARLFAGAESRKSATLIESALRAGISHFDTAPAYGSEDLLGEVLAGGRHFTIATKIGLPRVEGGARGARAFLGSVYRRTARPLLSHLPATKRLLLRVARGRDREQRPPIRRRMGRDEVMRSLENSLRRLRRTSVDVYLLHEPDGIEITDELLQVFTSLQHDRLIGAYGLAFGGGRGGCEHFGTVEQCRYPLNEPLAPHDGCLRVYHGLLRFGLSTRRGSDQTRSAPRLVAEALRRDAASAIVFSASSTTQIEAIARGCDGAL